LGAVVAVVAVLIQSALRDGQSERASRTQKASPARRAPLLPVLRRGARGPAVRRLQESLAAVGRYGGPADGIYGRMTHDAVTAFQQSIGLQPTGAADALTAAALARAVADLEAPRAATVRQGLADALSAGRLTRAAVDRYGEVLTRAVATLGTLSGTRRAALSAVLDSVAANASIYDEERARVLFGMLAVNRRYLARKEPEAERQDIEDDDGIVYRYYSGQGFQFQPLGSFIRLNAVVARDERRAARRLAYALKARGIREGDALYWEYYFPFHGPAPWRSGFAQALAAQALSRAAEALHDDVLAAAARAAFEAIPATLSRPLGGGTWIREYGFSDIAILNAQLQSLVSLTEYASRTSDPEVQRVVSDLDVASRTLLPDFDTGCWSLYSHGGEPASLMYHRYHVDLLRRLAVVRRNETIWRETASRWGAYLRDNDSPCSSRRE
jgi:peptidoglycan hydrolase-like protein with peptidoglycan-binding domain